MNNLNININEFSKYVINFINNTNEFNNISEKSKKISHLKLQKMLYFIYSYALVNWNKKLWNEEFYKWPHGPVIINIYNQYKEYKENEIITESTIDISKYLTNIEKLELESLLIELNENYTATQLRNLSHSQPWKTTEKSQPIKDEKIINYYSKNNLIINQLSQFNLD